MVQFPTSLSAPKTLKKSWYVNFIFLNRQLKAKTDEEYLPIYPNPLSVLQNVLGELVRMNFGIKISHL